MNSDKIDLYDPVILQYNKKNDRYQKRLDAQYVVEAINPVCGDSFRIYFDIEEDLVEEVTFSGYGCAVSKATTAVLVEMIENQTITEALKIIRAYLDLVDKGHASETVHPHWKAFQKAGAYPGRTQCAILSWTAIEQKFAKTK
jgi:nitrogen fixation NifU-like protein